jgi:hypothetical protein
MATSIKQTFLETLTNDITRLRKGNAGQFSDKTSESTDSDYRKIQTGVPGYL